MVTSEQYNNMFYNYCKSKCDDFYLIDYIKNPLLLNSYKYAGKNIVYKVNENDFKRIFLLYDIWHVDNTHFDYRLGGHVVDKFIRASAQFEICILDNEIYLRGNLTVSDELIYDKDPLILIGIKDEFNLYYKNIAHFSYDLTPENNIEYEVYFELFELDKSFINSTNDVNLRNIWQQMIDRCRIGVTVPLKFIYEYTTVR